MSDSLYTCLRRARPNIVLLASKLGEGVYRRLGFVDVDNLKFSFYQRPALPPPSRASSTPSLPNEQEHEDAIKLEQEAGGVYRGPLLNAIFEKDRRCAILKSESSVVAAAWGRYMAPTPTTNVPTLQIGPVVAKSPDFATSVIAELLRMDHAANADSRDTCIPAAALVVRRGKSEASRVAFKSLGFVEVAPVPYLQKSVVPDAEASRSSLDIAVGNEQYYAVTWWDFA